MYLIFLHLEDQAGDELGEKSADDSTGNDPPSALEQLQATEKVMESCLPYGTLGEGGDTIPASKKLLKVHLVVAAGRVYDDLMAASITTEVILSLFKLGIMKGSNA